jgi:hypothetical protein
MVPSDYDIHFGLCELALRSFRHPRGALQERLAHFALHVPLEREHYLQKVYRPHDEFSIYQCIEKVARELFGNSGANWGRVFTMYAFLSRLKSLQNSHDHVKMVADVVWKNGGLRSFINKVGWDSAVKTSKFRQSDSTCAVINTVLVLTVVAVLYMSFRK